MDHTCWDTLVITCQKKRSITCYSPVSNHTKPEPRHHAVTLPPSSIAAAIGNGLITTSPTPPAAAEPIVHTHNHVLAQQARLALMHTGLAKAATLQNLRIAERQGPWPSYCAGATKRPDGPRPRQGCRCAGFATQSTGVINRGTRSRCAPKQASEKVYQSQFEYRGNSLHITPARMAGKPSAAARTNTKRVKKNLRRVYVRLYRAQHVRSRPGQRSHYGPWRKHAHAE